MDPDIQKLINITTIVKVDDNFNETTILGDSYAVSRFNKDQGNQIDLAVLENNWNNKWNSFDDLWTKERQNYRFLRESFRFFHLSFEQLRCNKCNQENKDKNHILYFNELTGVNLCGVYNHGKKCIDLLSELKLIDSQNQNWNFCEKFIGTRNKIFEHNYKPWGLNIQTDPETWSLRSTDSFLEIRIHTDSQEHLYSVCVDYYEDYYNLEKIISDIIKKF